MGQIVVKSEFAVSALIFYYSVITYSSRWLIAGNDTTCKAGASVALVPPMSTTEVSCLAWYNVVLTPRIHSIVKYSQLEQSANICDVSIFYSASNQHARHTCEKNRNDNKHGT